MTIAATDWPAWDATAAKLERIEHCAEMIEYYASQMENACSILKERPSFETRAEAAMESAMKKLEEARSKFLATTTNGD